MFKKKRGQAAMEFLMTYGWAILVVLIVIGALAYFGILNPQQFLPKKCQFSTGLVCQDHVIRSTGGGTIRVNNGLGNDIRINALNFTSDNGQIKCNASIISNDGILTAGDNMNIEFPTASNDPSPAVGWSCASSDLVAFKGSRIRGDLEIDYTDLQTNFDHTIVGELLTDVE